MSLRSTDETGGEVAQIKLRVQAARRARAATALVSITILTAIGICLYRIIANRSPYSLQVILLMGLIGIVLLGMGRTAKSRRLSELAILRFYRSFRFYGVVVSTSATFVLVYALVVAPNEKVRARENSAPVVVAVTPPAPAPPDPVVELPPSEPEFPKLEVTGVIVSGGTSSALINNRTVLVGETISGVRLTRVSEDGVIVELEGAQKMVPRTKPASPTTSKTTPR